MRKPGKEKEILVYEYVTGGGLSNCELRASWAREGSAMRRAAASEFAAVEGLRVTMALDDRLPDEPGLWSIERFGSDRESFVDCARRSDYTLVIAPETGGVLADLVEWLLGAGVSLLNANPESIRASGDKSRLADLWNKALIPHPLTVTFDRKLGLPDGWGWPIVIKPIDGAGGIDTYILFSEEELSAWPFYEGIAIAQPWVAGEPMSASFLVDRSGRPHLVCSGVQMIEWANSRFAYVGGELPVPTPEVVHPLLDQAIAAVAGLSGWVGVDYLWDPRDGEATLIELNPRLTTSFVGVREQCSSGSIARAWLDLHEKNDPSGVDRLNLELRDRQAITFGANG